MPDKIETPEPTEEEEFGTFFNDALETDKGDIVPDEDEVVEKPEKVEVKEVPEVIPDPEEVVLVPTPLDAVPDPADEVVKCANCKTLEHKMASWEGRITAANKRADSADKRADDAEKALAEKVVAATAVAPESSTEDDDRIIADFEAEFPALVEPVKIYAKKEAARRVSKLRGEIEPSLVEIKQGRTEDATAAHFRTIAEAHPDHSTIVKSGKIKAWIEAQPAIFQDSLLRVYTSGNATEVVELFDTYKRVNNLTLKPKEPTPGDIVPKKKAKDLIAVPAVHGDPPTDKGVDKDDFDAAWNEANSGKK